MLRPVPPYGHREVLLLFAAMSTVDPGDVFAAVQRCKEAKIRWGEGRGAVVALLLAQAGGAAGVDALPGWQWGS